MRAQCSCIHACACALVCVLLLTGCGQRIHAEVSSVVEPGYQARGQTYALELMPGFVVEDPAAARAALETTLVPALQDMGYVAATAGQSPDVPDVVVRVWWGSTGPHPVYRRVAWRDRRYGRRWHGYRRQVVVVEDEYARYLVVEGIGMDAGAALAADPMRVLWRVRVESRGNLARAERVLQPLAAAAAPFMGKSGLVHVLVKEGEVVASEAVAP